MTRVSESLRQIAVSNRKLGWLEGTAVAVEKMENALEKYKELGLNYEAQLAKKDEIIAEQDKRNARLVRKLIEKIQVGNSNCTTDGEDLAAIILLIRKIMEKSKAMSGGEDSAAIIEHLNGEVERYQQWVRELQSGMTVNCVYCGHSYGPAEETPVSMADVLKEHIEHCPEHPMAKLKVENERLAAEVERLTRERDAG